MFNEDTWKDGEIKTQNYMKKVGYKIIYTNFSCVGVELDIVSVLSKKMQIRKLKHEYRKKFRVATRAEKLVLKKSLKNFIKTINTDLLVITEVKARKNDNFGVGAESVTPYKKEHIIRGARFLQSKPEFSKYQIRFDVSSVDDGKITYIENAF